MKFEPYEMMADHHKIKLADDEELWAIGDVHGCEEEYAELIRKVTYESYKREKHAVIIQLGDMIDRGPGFADMLLYDAAKYKVMGNHEHNFIAEWRGQKKCRSNSRMVNHAKMLELEDDKAKNVIAQLSGRKSFFTYESYCGMFVFTHAPFSGLENEWDLKNVFGKTSISDFAMRSRVVDYDKVKALTELTTHVHGHQSWSYTDIHEQIDDQKLNPTRVFNLDSGCVYGGELVALSIPDLCVVRVKSNISVEKSKIKQ